MRIAGQLIRIDLPHDAPPLVILQSIDEELTVQMIDLMLEASGQFTRAGHDDLLLLEIHPRCYRAGRPVPQSADARDGQAGLKAIGYTVQVQDPRIIR